jgi:hypothetical protein
MITIANNTTSINAVLINHRKSLFSILIWRAPAAGIMAAAMKEFVRVIQRDRDNGSIPLESEAGNPNDSQP